MAEITNIQWCDSTFNPFIGCTKVSVGPQGACVNCYAEVATPVRVMGIKWGAGQARYRTSEATWKQPLAWERHHAAFYAQHGRRQRVFCASLADVFDNQVDPQWRADLFGLIRQTPHLDWLLLTKRIGNAEEMIEDAIFSIAEPFKWTYPWRSRPWPNVWIGATIANQAEADRDVPKLLDTPARVRFLSCEPLLGPIDLRHVRAPKHTDADEDDWTFDALNTGDCYSFWDGQYWEIGDGPERPHQIVIAGGESGTRARPSHPDWFRSLRDQCVSTGVPYLFKQWGEWWPMSQMPDGVSDSFYDPKYGNGKRESDRYERSPPKRRDVTTTVLQLDGTESFEFPPGAMTCYKAGKKAAGRTLDGRVWDQFPGDQFTEAE